MTPDLLQFDHTHMRHSDLPLFQGLIDPSLTVPFFNKWKWLPHPETNARSGIFVRCNTEYTDSIVDLPEVIPVKYGLHSARVEVTEEMATSLERDLITPTDNHITPSAMGTVVFVSMKFGKYDGKYYDLGMLFQFFCEIREFYLRGTVKGGLDYGVLDFRWYELEQLEKFLFAFAEAFYEWDTPWNPNL